MQKKQTILVVASLLVVVLSVTLAYFTAQIIGKGKDVSVTSNNLQILFDHSDGNITGTDITPGWSSTKKFTITNKSNATYKYDIVIQNLVNTFVTDGYLQYKITSDNGGFSTTDYVDVPKSETETDTILAYSASIDVGVTQSYTVEFIYKNDENVDQSDDMGKTLSGKLFITEGTEAPSLYDKMLSDNPTRSSRDTFTAFTDNTTGTLFTATEQIGTNEAKEVYYYAGNTTNNWVKFGGFYWRIIRTNHDGSVKLLYVGTRPDTTSGYIGTSKFNSTPGDPMYVGYKYGTSGSLENNRTNTNDSVLKTYVDNWYKNNLINYTKFLSRDAVYCNDRNLASGSTYSTTSKFYYASYERIETNKQPTYDCTNISDAFSVNNVSAKLDYPIGLMSIDEFSYAGGQTSKLTSPYAWYYTNANGESITGDTWTWSLSPFLWIDDGSFAWFVDGSDSPGRFAENFIDDSNAVRPAISLKSCTKWASGDGSAENPYTIKETESGC